MRIHGKWRADYDAGFLSALFSSRSLGILRQEVDFLVDTGAVKTAILDWDAKVLDIDHRRLSPYRYRLPGIGGSVDTYAVTDSTLTFTTDEGGSHEERIEVLVIKHARLNGRVEKLPSILGRDILERYHLIYSKPYQKIYFTDENLNI